MLCQLGTVYRLQKRFQLSIQFHILQLELAWEQRDTTNEMKAYENISMAYYYLGNISHASYYMKRVIDGVYEPDNSVMKRIALTMIRNNRDKLKTQGYRHIIDEFERNSKRNYFRLSQNSRTNDQSNPALSQTNTKIEFSRPRKSLSHSRNLLSMSMDKRKQSPSKKMLLPGLSQDTSQSRLAINLALSATKKDASFELEHLKHLNKKPKYEYLKGKSKIVVRTIGGKSAWRNTNFEDKDVITKIFNKYEQEKSRIESRKSLLTNEGFRNMIKGVLLRRGRSTSNKEQVYYTHLSQLRNIQGVVLRSLEEGIRGILEMFLKVIKHF